MKTGLLLLTSFALLGCQLLPQPVPVPAQQPAETLLEQPAEVEPAAPVADVAALTIDDTAKTLQAWVNYRTAVLGRLNEERDLLNTEANQDEVWQLKRTMLQLHPDTPYLNRLRIQMQLSEQLASLPAPLAELLSWDLAFNQKLLEAESAVSALTRLNAQQHDNIERLQKINKELQKKIDALTQIEAQLNQPDKGQEDNNGQF